MPKYRPIKYGKHSFTYEAGQMWNQLDDEINRSINVDVFKRLSKVLFALVLIVGYVH